MASILNKSSPATAHSPLDATFAFGATPTSTSFLGSAKASGSAEWGAAPLGSFLQSGFSPEDTNGSFAAACISSGFQKFDFSHEPSSPGSHTRASSPSSPATTPAFTSGFSLGRNIPLLPSFSEFPTSGMHPSYTPSAPAAASGRSTVPSPLVPSSQRLGAQYHSRRDNADDGMPMLTGTQLESGSSGANLDLPVAFSSSDADISPALAPIAAAAATSAEPAAAAALFSHLTAVRAAASAAAAEVAAATAAAAAVPADCVRPSDPSAAATLAASGIALSVSGRRARRKIIERRRALRELADAEDAAEAAEAAAAAAAAAAAGVTGSVGLPPPPMLSPVLSYGADYTAGRTTRSSHVAAKGPSVALSPGAVMSDADELFAGNNSGGCGSVGEGETSDDSSRASVVSMPQPQPQPQPVSSSPVSSAAPSWLYPSFPSATRSQRAGEGTGAAHMLHDTALPSPAGSGAGVGPAGYPPSMGDRRDAPLLDASQCAMTAQRVSAAHEVAMQLQRGLLMRCSAYDSSAPSNVSPTASAAANAAAAAAAARTAAALTQSTITPASVATAAAFASSTTYVATGGSRKRASPNSSLSLAHGAGAGAGVGEEHGDSNNVPLFAARRRPLLASASPNSTSVPPSTPAPPTRIPVPVPVPAPVTALGYSSSGGSGGGAHSPVSPVYPAPTGSPTSAADPVATSASSNTGAGAFKAPKRACNAYMYYCRERRPQLKREFPRMSFADIGAKLGATWKHLPARERLTFEEMARVDQERFTREMASHVAMAKLGAFVNSLTGPTAAGGEPSSTTATAAAGPDNAPLGDPAAIAQLRAQIAALQQQLQAHLSAAANPSSVAAAAAAAAAVGAGSESYQPMIGGLVHLQHHHSYLPSVEPDALSGSSD